MASKATQQRIWRIKNRIARTEARLRACDDVSGDETRRTRLLGIVAACAESAEDFESLVDDVADRLDDIIEPRNPFAEWLTDVGIDIAAFAAVVVWRGTHRRLQRRLARDKATLARLVARED